jgi:hypothetical protein
MLNTAKDIIQGKEKAKKDRVVIEATWEDLLYYGFPRKRGVNAVYQPGDKPSWDVFDDTPVQSNLILAAGLSGYMTNASQLWFELRARDEALMDNGNVRQFFSKSADVLYSLFANSNFYQQIHETYIDLGVLGTGALYEEEDTKDVFRFYCRKPKEIYIVEDDREDITMVYRCFPLTAYQAYKLFNKENCGKAVLDAVEQDKDYNKQFDFIHYICIRHVRQAGKKDNRNKPVASYWVSEADKKIVKESGYDEFPMFCPRFYKNSGEAYGYSPMYTCYPDVLTLNRAVETYIEAAEFAIKPAWIAESDGVIGTLDLRKDAINYQRAPLAQGAQVQQLTPKGNVQVGIDFIQRAEEKVKRAFFVDLFLTLANKQGMTATEVTERVQEKMLILGPVLGRLQSELLNPVIYRSFNIALRAGKLPPVPKELEGQEWDVVHVSPLAKAQRALHAKDMQTFMMIVGQMGQMWPQVLDKIDADNVIDKMAKAYSVDPDIINDDEEVDAIRKQRAEQMAAQQKQLAIAGAAETADKIGSATEKFARAKSTSRP